MLSLLATSTLAVACGAGGQAHRAVESRGACAPPVPAASSEVRATVGGTNGGDCVAFVDEAVSPVHARPAIWRHRGGAWERLPLDGEDFQNQGWMAVTAAGDTVLAALDSRIESPGWELTILRSTDRGATWSAPVRVRKPYYLATLRELHLEPGGRSTLVVELGDDYGAGVTPGRYEYVSDAAGARWTRARAPAGGVPRPDQSAQ